MMDGKVVFAGIKGGYGKTVIVEHENGRESVYAHCDQVCPAWRRIESEREDCRGSSTGVSLEPLAL